MDRFPIRVVVVGLVLVLILGMGAVTFLAFTQTPIPDILGTLVVGALTGTTALLARTNGSPESTPVTVTNTSAEPVPVDATPAQPAVVDAAGWPLT